MHRPLLSCLLLSIALHAQESFLVRFGADGGAPRDWSGEMRGAASVEPWQFDEGDSASANSWTAATRVETFWHAPWERTLFGTKREERLSERGLIVSSAADRLEFDTAAGEFEFAPSQIGWGEPLRLLDAAVEVSRVPEIERIAGRGAEDFPALLVTRAGEEWIAWQTYTEGGDRLWVRRDEQAPEPLTPAERELFRVVLAEGPGGEVWAVWSEMRDRNWDLYARVWRDGSWAGEQRLTSAPGSDIFHALASDESGRLYLAWQSLRGGQSDIYLRIYSDGEWGNEIPVASDPANDWEPAVAARDGRAAVAWDSYRNGNYDVYVRFVENGELSERTPVAETPSFEARPSIAFDEQGRLWLAWEEGDSQWGKDYVNGVAEAGMGLLMRRQTRVGVWVGGELRQLPGEPFDTAPPEARHLSVAPKLALDSAGNPWVFYRHRTGTPRRPQPTYRTMWRQGATTFRDGRWVEMIRFPRGFGRMDAPLAAARDPEGGLRVVWPGDGRDFPAGFPGEQDLYRATLPSGPPTELELSAFRFPGEDFAAVHPNEAGAVAQLRPYRRQVDGRTMGIVRGDMHRHTDLSWDGNRDGSLFDAYRYALDAAGMDYLGVADHMAGAGVDHHWRKIQRAADLFTMPGVFAPLYGYERSRGYPSGHRNVMFAQPGVPVFPFSRAEREDNANTGVEPLYEHLRENKGIVMVHTSATGAGTDWTDSAQDVEPLVEIYQGYRTNYETADAPRGGGDRPAGFVWNAWAKGLKLGVQSSSDHVSTHASYGMIWVDEVTSEAVLEGIRARRSYAATDNILLDFSVNGAVMGGAIRAQGPPRIEAKAIGTAPIARIEVVRDNTYIHTHEPESSEATFAYVDNDATPGEHWYYVRVEQQDGQLAWASPVWVSVVR